MPEGTIRPTRSPFHNLTWLVTEPYGTYDNGGTHNGMDLTQYPYNSQDFTIPVYSICENGIVLATGTGNASMGNWVRFKDLESNYAFTYMHLLDNSISVSSGDHLDYGTKIGIMGSTGESTALHLHIEARNMTGTTNADYLNSPRTSPSDYLGIVNKSYREYWALYYWEYNGGSTSNFNLKNGKFNWALYGNKSKFI